MKFKVMTLNLSTEVMTLNLSTENDLNLFEKLACLDSSQSTIKQLVPC